MPPKFGGGGNMCKRCNKTVYQAEEKKDPKGGYWHSSCFTCKNCPNNNKSTRLDSTNINIHEGTRPLLQPNRIRVFHNFQFAIKSLKTVFSRQRNGAGPLSAHLSYPLATIFARMLTIRFWPNSLETVTAHCACSNLPNFLPRSSSLIFREVLGTRYSRRDLFSIQLLWENVFLSQMKSTARGVMELCLAPKATDLAEELAP